MGLFDIFMSEEKQIVRHTRRLMNRDSQPEDRESSAIWLAQNSSAMAISGLIRRFEIKLDHGMKDKTEKDELFSLLVDLGSEKVSGPLRNWLRHKSQFAIPLRLLQTLDGDAAAVEMAIELLDVEVKKDNFKPGKKLGLLTWLNNYVRADMVDVGAPLLNDFDEGVRCAAADLLIATESDTAALPLCEALFREEEDSGRLKTRLANIFAQRGWVVSSGYTDNADRLPSDFTIQDNRIVTTRER
jgi:hypothetical protein